MNVIINGDAREVETGVTVVGLLALFGLAPGIVLVQINDEIVNRTRYAETALAEGDRVELVRFIAGG